MNKRKRFIRVGIGGWTYAPWRDNFYPADLTHARELEYASRKVTAIEINGTYYSTQKPATFARWAVETPEDFIFSVKASRYTTNRRVLAEAGESVERFVGSGLVELGPKLGPILWQFAPTKQFDAADFSAFLDLLPQKIDGLPLRHVMDVRHASFRTPEFFKLMRKYKVASVFTDSADYPSFADFSTDFVYVRLMCSQPEVATGYPSKALDTWAARIHGVVEGGTVNHADGFPQLTSESRADVARDMFVFFINGAKERAPSGAIALLQRLAKLEDA